MSSRLAFQTQLASIMEVLANAAVAEICKLVDDDYAVVRLQMSQCQRENKALKRKLHLLELKMARGNAERRLRESALSSSRPRVHVSADDRLREPPPAGGVYERQIDVALWSSRASAEDAASQPLRSDSVQSKSPDVELVEPEAVLVKEEKMESNMSRAEEVENDVALIGDDGVLECVPRGLTGQRANEQQGNQMQTGRARRPSSRSSRGVEREEEPDVVLVKVEEMESVRAAQNETGLSIQEGLVESSTDDYRGVLPFEESTQSSSQRCDLQDPSRAFSEVSYGHSSLWTNRGGSYCRNDSLAGPSSHSNPPLYAEAQHGSSGRALAAETVESSRGFHTSVTFEQQPTVIDLSEEPVPVQASGQVQGGLLSVQVPQHFLDPGPSQGQASYSGTHARQKMPRKRVYLCRFCSKGFTSPANLESHLRTHTGERPYGCNLCGKKFSQFWNLKIHRNTHTGERPYQCSLCPEKFSDPSNLKKHQKRHHSQLYANSEGCLNQPHPAAGISEESSSASVQLGTADSNSPANPKTQEQQGCGNLNPLTSEYSLFELETFFTRWAPDDASAPSEPLCSFATDDSAKCNKDGVVLAQTERCLSSAARRSTAEALSRPLRMQAPSAPSDPSPWRRTQGRMSAPSQRDHSSAAVTHSDGGDSAPALSLPCRKMNSGVAPPLGFGVALSAQHRATLLARHNKSHAVSTMPNERRRKSYACQACGKAFSGLSNLEAHERVHTGEKPFRCDTCGKHFSEAGNLKKHQRVHTGEKPFSCDQCGKRFAWICNLRTHQQSATGCVPPARGGSGLG